MAEIDYEKIRIVAYELWEQDGSQHGRDDEYWHAAVKLLSEEQAGRNAEDSPLLDAITPLTPPL